MLLLQEPIRDPTETAPVLNYRIEYRVNEGELITIDLFPEDYNPSAFSDVVFTLDAVCVSHYEINITAFNIRGAGEVFTIPEFNTPCDSELTELLSELYTVHILCATSCV